MEQIECIFRMTLDNLADGQPESSFRTNPNNSMPFNIQEDIMIGYLDEYDVWNHNE